MNTLSPNVALLIVHSVGLFQWGFFIAASASHPYRQPRYLVQHV
jgi:hypothetical protein